MRHPFIRRAKRNNILTELLERSADYRARCGSTQKLDQDDDTESQSGRSEWEYPTIRSTKVDNDYNTVRDMNTIIASNTPINQIDSVNNKQSENNDASMLHDLTNNMKNVSINNQQLFVPKSDKPSHILHSSSVTSSQTQLVLFFYYLNLF